MKSANKLISEQWELFLKVFADKISAATPSYPASRCWTYTSLAKLVQAIRKEYLPSTFPNTPKILEHLKNIGWAYPVEVGLPSEKPVQSKEFYLFDVTASHGVKVDHLELMQAYKPEGVICYFSALVYYSLTTQFAPHHHIATLSDPPSKIPVKKKIDRTTATPASKSGAKRISMGTLAFSYQSVPCYLTKRFTSRLVGYQTHVYNSRTNLIITTLEQTLLDTLHKPACCGGINVIMEAWEEAVSDLDEDLLGEYLEKINYPLLTRRVGAIFDLIEYEPGAGLSETIDQLSGLQQNNCDIITLLPGFDFSNVNEKWNVLTP